MSSTHKLGRISAAFSIAALAIGLVPNAAFAQSNDNTPKGIDQFRYQNTLPVVKAEKRAPDVHAQAFKDDTVKPVPTVAPPKPIPLIVPLSPELQKTVDAEKKDKEERVVRLYDEVNDETATDVIQQLSDLNEKDHAAPITLHVNSPGGVIKSGQRIIDAMKTLDAPVYTECDEFCASMAAVIVAAGEPGHRTAMPSATIMIHQLSGGTSGTDEQMTSEFKFIEDLKNSLTRIMAEASGHTMKEMRALYAPDRWLTAKEAKDIRLIDSVNEIKHKPPHPLPE